MWNPDVSTAFDYSVEHQSETSCHLEVGTSMDPLVWLAAVSTGHHRPAVAEQGVVLTWLLNSVGQQGRKTCYTLERGGDDNATIETRSRLG
jgi:hypothetical protein